MQSIISVITLTDQYLMVITAPENVAMPPWEPPPPGKRTVPGWDGADGGQKCGFVPQKVVFPPWRAGNAIRSAGVPAYFLGELPHF